MLTEDQNIVQVNLSVQYTVANPQDFLLKVYSPTQSLQHATESALRHAVGSAEMHQILTEGREQIGVEVQQRLQGYLDSYQTGIHVSKVNIDDTRAPEAVQAAFDDVIKAKEDEERVKNEAESYKNGIVPEARGKAKRLEEEALGYKLEVIARASGDASRFEQLLAEYERAPDVTRSRLYLDSVQNIMEKTSKVVVDVEGGNNMMYLPLDQLMKRSAQVLDDTSEPMSDQNVQQLTDRVVQQIRRQSARVRETR
jgi:membrane protease subunit HflK